MEKTLVVLKPDAVQRGLIGEILGRLERRGLKIVALRMTQVSDDLARRMYAVHEGKDFYKPLVRFITASPVVAMVVQGVGAIEIVRNMMGPTFGPDAPGGTIRGDLGLSRRYNLIHGSDSLASARQEIPLFFQAEDILDYSLPNEQWVYSEIDK
ncbi:nucleoside-diphosphate kinase [Candidatus Heimdallarchaeota archaeon]|nr:MAG: nucleoside-diphosphate kinase [Planctomycetota bacterium]RLI72426.1 MAG: nucleoside-diphosphate kinase [Candidatus Heimdallarchaeota archaeon]